MDKGGLLFRQKGDILLPLQPLLENAYFQQKSCKLDSPGRGTMNGLLLPNEECGGFHKVNVSPAGSLQLHRKDGG